MAFDINEFVTNLDQNNSTAHANMFNVNIFLPSGLIYSGYGMRQLQLTCEASELPGIDITPIEYRHYGFTKRIPHHFNFTPLNLTFYCTGAMMEKRLFDAWMGLCIDKNSGLINYRIDNDNNLQYEADITISQFDPAGRVTYFAQALECFPISISPINTNWSDDSVHRLNVQFMFTKWLNLDEGATGQSGDAYNPATGFVSNFTNLIRFAEGAIKNPQTLATPQGAFNTVAGITTDINNIITNPFEL